MQKSFAFLLKIWGESNVFNMWEPYKFFLFHRLPWFNPHVEVAQDT